ncbi:MAG: MaoC family dehydratase [Betaproteobacteria bacterium]|nr:MAG: MaoC family dehydratase [Betaproteobacteria bacterium]
MSLDRRKIGTTLPEFSVTIGTDALARFACAIGEHHLRAESDPVPPTYLKVIEGVGGSSRRIVDALGIDLRRMLHAKQEFEYLAPLRVGATLTVVRTVSDIFQKKEGELEFVVIETRFRDAAGTLVALSRQTLLVRTPGPAHAARS